MVFRRVALPFVNCTSQLITPVWVLGLAPPVNHRPVISVPHRLCSPPLSGLSEFSLMIFHPLERQLSMQRELLASFLPPRDLQPALSSALLHPPSTAQHRGYPALMMLSTSLRLERSLSLTGLVHVPSASSSLDKPSLFWVVFKSRVGDLTSSLLASFPALGTQGNGFPKDSELPKSPQLG